ncbi:hypothetical protein PG984_012484 [Apiospora sp. TS-2023a]
MWANNIGAFRDPSSSSSLDNRLRNTVDMKEAVSDGLMSLSNSSTQACDIVKGIRPDMSTMSSGSNAVVSVNIDQSHNVKPPDSASRISTPGKTELSELFRSLQLTVDRLFQLSMLIRRERPRGRIPTSFDLVTDEVNYDVRHVKDTFPKVREGPDWVARRFGEAISTRKAIVRYRERHEAHLREAAADRNMEADQSDAISTVATTAAGMPLNHGEAASCNSVSGAPSTLTTIGTILNDEKGILDLESFIFKNVRLQYGVHFTCPFCRTIQLFHTDKSWRRHVFTDFLPYVCTFEACSSGLFSTRHEWIGHEMECHRAIWQCSHCAYSSRDEPELENHYEESHAEYFTKKQLQFIIGACKQPTRFFAAGSCLLCDEWTPPLNLEDNAEAFFRHLSKHQQQLALSAQAHTIIDDLVIVENSNDTEMEADSIHSIIQGRLDDLVIAEDTSDLDSVRVSPIHQVQLDDQVIVQDLYNTEPVESDGIPPNRQDRLDDLVIVEDSNDTGPMEPDSIPPIRQSRLERAREDQAERPRLKRPPRKRKARPQTDICLVQ